MERNDDVMVLSLQGRLDVVASDKVRDEIVRLLENKPCIISLAGCDYVSSSGLRALLMIAKAAKGRGIRLIFAAACAEVVDVFEMTGFLRLLECVPTIAAAEAQLR